MRTAVTLKVGTRRTGRFRAGRFRGGQVPGGQVPDRHTGNRPAGAFARRFAISVGAAAMAAIGLPEVS